MYVQDDYIDLDQYVLKTSSEDKDERRLHQDECLLGSKKQCKSIIVKFTSFRKRTLVYHGKKSIKDIRVKVDLTKKRYTLFVKANEYVKNIRKIKFCYADINCRLKVKWEVTGTSDSFFSSFDQLKSIIEDDE